MNGVIFRVTSFITSSNHFAFFEQNLCKMNEDGTFTKCRTHVERGTQKNHANKGYKTSINILTLMRCRRMIMGGGTNRNNFIEEQS